MTKTLRSCEDAGVVVTDANLFRGLGLPNAQERHTKTKIALRFSEVIEESGLSATDAANRIGLSLYEISDIMRGRTCGFTIDRLLKALTALNQNVEIRVSPECEAQIMPVA